MDKDIKKQKRKSEAIWAAEAMREETRRALRGKPQEEDEEDKVEEKEEERPFFPEYQIDLVRAAFKSAKEDGKEIPVHDPKIKYTTKDIGKIIKVVEKVGLEGRLGYIVDVVQKIDGTDSGRLYVLLKKGDKLEKEKCWFYATK